MTEFYETRLYFKNCMFVETYTDHIGVEVSKKYIVIIFVCFWHG